MKPAAAAAAAAAMLALLATSTLAGDLIAQPSPPSVGINFVTEGTACSGVGATGFDSSGKMLTCQSGVWTGLEGGHWGGSFFTSPGHGGCYSKNPITGSCSCPAGHIAYWAYAIQVGGCYPCTLYQCSKN